MNVILVDEDSLKKWFIDWLFQDRTVHIENIDLSDSPGIPDTNYCCEGTEGWFEFKWIGKKGCKIRAQQTRWFRERAMSCGRAHMIWGTKNEFGAISGEHVWKLEGRLNDRNVYGISTPGLHAGIDRFTWYDALIGERQ